ncbi:MAG: hypothetical protein IJI38_10315, partial [Clostridia bacterium]|nr:hypothetical protein [Clostridia bacterium]
TGSFFSSLIHPLLDKHRSADMAETIVPNIFIMTKYILAFSGSWFACHRRLKSFQWGLFV